VRGTRAHGVLRRDLNRRQVLPARRRIDLEGSVRLTDHENRVNRRLVRRPTRSVEPTHAHSLHPRVLRSMQRLSRMLIQLNLATRDHHVAADAPWLELLVPTVTKRQYIDHLIRVYGFEAPLEAALHYTPGLSALVDLRSRVRSGLIVQDLMRLGMSPGRIAGLGQRFVTFSSTIEALGWMYVAERATCSTARSAAT
jgi:hypothetical protein